MPLILPEITSCPAPLSWAISGKVRDVLKQDHKVVAIVNDEELVMRGLAAMLTPHESLSLLFAQGKNRYDTAILGAFIRMMGVYPPGSAVQLTDDRYALVVSVNSTRPLKPTVLVHDPKVPSDEALPLNLESDGRLGIRRSVKVQQLPAEARAYLSPRPRIAYFFEPNLEPDSADTPAARSPNP